MENLSAVDVKPSKIKTLINQFGKFFIVGIMNTSVDLIILNIETLLTGVTEGIGYSVQKGVSFLVAVTMSYFLNKNWTFGDSSKAEQGKKFSQFIFVSIIGMIINITVATVVVTYFKPIVNSFLNLTFLTDQIWVSIGALCGTAVGLIWNFAGYKFWVFKK
jgi:putative flippase GtrA